MTSRFWRAGGNALLPGHNFLADTTAALSPYTGQVATRSAIPDGLLAQTKIMSRTTHYAAEALNSIKVKFPAWYCSGQDQAVAGSNVTYTASIEYPSGTFTQVKWSASSSVVAVIGSDTGLSDATTVSIPSGAKFWVRSYATTTAANIPTGTNAFWSGNDAAVIDGTATDLTMSGTVTNTSAGMAVYPLCIVQTTTRPTFLLLGDSRTSVAGVDAFGNVGQFAPSLASYGYINAGKSAALVQDLVNGTVALRVALSQYVSHVINGFGINDLQAVNTWTAAQVEAEFVATAYAMPTKAHILATLSPYTTSTDSWTTTTNQTTRTNEAARVAFNTWVRTLPDPFCAYVDIASVTESGSTGKWVANYTSDGLHQNSTGAAAIVSAGVLNPATLGATPAVGRFSPLEFSPFEWFDANNAAAAGTTPILPTWGGTPVFSAISTVTYGATAFNSGPGYTISSGAALDRTNSPVSQNAAGFFIGMFVNWPATPGSATAVGGFTINGSNSVQRCMVMIDTSGKPGLAIRRLDGDTTVTSYGSSALTAGSPYLITVQADPAGGTATLYVNGVLTATANYASTGSTSNTAAGFSIYNFLGSGGGGFVFGEHVAFNVPSATSTIRQKLEGDMAWRRGAAATFLPAGHPYLSVRPPL